MPPGDIGALSETGMPAQKGLKRTRKENKYSVGQAELRDIHIETVCKHSELKTKTQGKTPKCTRCLAQVKRGEDEIHSGA